ncbi:MAG: hypothetical protein R3321_09735 [Nitrososphaeraceae archaeon]|nr:hypothetical protein [Nitrososphaeraceae archaeon]
MANFIHEMPLFNNIDIFSVDIFNMTNEYGSNITPFGNELLDNDGAFLLDNDGVQLIDNV